MERATQAVEEHHTSTMGTETETGTRTRTRSGTPSTTTSSRPTTSRTPVHRTSSGEPETPTPLVHRTTFTFQPNLLPASVTQEFADHYHRLQGEGRDPDEAFDAFADLVHEHTRYDQLTPQRSWSVKEYTDGKVVSTMQIDASGSLVAMGVSRSLVHSTVPARTAGGFAGGLGFASEG